MIKYISIKELDNYEIAFDHKDIIKLAVERIRTKIYWSDLAFDLIKNKKQFTIYELQKIYEAILDKKLDVPNFRRMFESRFVKEQKVEKTGEKCKVFSRPSDYYRLK